MLGTTTFSQTGLVVANGDTIAGVTLTSTGAAAGAAASPPTYAIVASAATGSGLSNYTITYHDGTLTVDKAVLTVTADDKSKQYSDPLPTFTASHSGFKNGENLLTSGVTGSPSLTTTATAISAPGPYTITAALGTLASTNYTFSFVPGTLTVTKEDARVTYAGNIFIGIPLSSTSAPVTLIATIQDITALGPYNAGPPPTGDPAYDAYSGDIRNATLTFVNRDASNTTLCTASVLLVNSSDTKTGSVTCTFNGTVGSTGSTQYTVGILVDGYYTRNASTDDTVVTISQVGAGMITGGGYLVLQNSAGTIAGDSLTKNNFGFNVKYTKSGSSLQGNINSIVRRKESDGILHVYQIKGNSMTSLAVYQWVNNAWAAGCTEASSTSPCKAQFNGKANIQDITNPLASFSVTGNNSLQFNMTDYGSPGSSDTVGITLWNGSGGIWFSSDWVGTPPATAEQLLGGGNLVVH